MSDRTALETRHVELIDQLRRVHEAVATAENRRTSAPGDLQWRTMNEDADGAEVDVLIDDEWHRAGAAIELTRAALFEIETELAR